uniref:Major facilitator superfamily (MFS) profile domain-containing protein n=1 Tax=Bionectria ochroleuca TaxID=29856 RepID=A0A8H7NN52_BIOOC
MAATKETVVVTVDAADIVKDSSATSSSKSEGDPDSTNTPAVAVGEATPYLTGFKLFILMSGLTTLMLLVMLDIAILSTAIPQITSDFNRLQDVGWYVGAYSLASATVQPLTGKFYTYFNTKWTLLTFFFIFEVGSAVCGAAQCSVMLIIGRCIAGIGCAGLSNGTLTVIVGAVSNDKRPLYTGIAMGIGQIGIIIGPIISGAFTEHVTWRWCFYINLPLGALVGLFLISIHIPDHIVKRPLTTEVLKEIFHNLDLTGFALFAPASIMLLLALQFGSGDYGWKSPAVIGCFCGAGAIGILFLFWEKRMGKKAMIPLELVRRQVVWSSSIYYACSMSVTIGGGSFMPIYFQSVRGLAPTMSAVYILPSIFGQIFFILLSGGLMTRLGYYIPWAAFAAGVSSIGSGVIGTWKPSTTLAQIFGIQILYSARGAGMQAGAVALQNTLPADEIAVGTSFLIFCQNIISSIFVTIANTVFQESLRSRITNTAPGVSPEQAILAGGGADAVRKLAPAGSELLEKVLMAYSEGFGDVFYFYTAVGVVSFFASFGMGWVDLRKNIEKKDETEGPDVEK